MLPQAQTVQATPATADVMPKPLAPDPVEVPSVTNPVKETNKPSSVSAIRVGCYTEEEGGREDPGGLFKGAFF